MRKTLLIAAAALAASVISSEAQVYSQNIVGYANLPAPVGGKNYLISCPFLIGASNGLNEIFGSTLPTNTKLLIWNGVNDYNIALYDPTDPNSVGAGAPVWYHNDDSTPLDPLPSLYPGTGFFLLPPTPVTNTFAGTVMVPTGSSSNLVMGVGGKNYLISGLVPYAGIVTNGNSSGGGLNLNALPTNTKLLFWNGVNDYKIALYDPTDPNSVGAGAPLWYNNDDSTPYVDPSTGGNVPSVIVGQGFFVLPPTPYTMTNGLPAN